MGTSLSKQVSVTRDAGQQQAGFRLQKLRAVELLFDSVERNETALVYCSIENEEDVNHVDSTTEKNQYLEQNKQYDPDSSFTFNSNGVISTVVNFIYCWKSKDFSALVHFGFYATNRAGKERSTEKTESLNITLPDQSILSLLADKKFDHANLLSSVKAITLDYVSQAKEGTPEKSVHETIQSWHDADWKDFFNKIAWRFGQEDSSALQSALLQRIKTSKIYKNRDITDREGIILSRLVDLLDDRQSKSNPTERFIYGSDVKLAILEVSTGADKIDDPTWKLWETIQTSDKRNLKDKLVAVCADFPNRKINSLSRTASTGLALHQQSDRDKRILSVRYRVYDACKDLLDKFIEENAGKPLTDGAIDTKIEELVAAAKARLDSLETDHNYPVKSVESIKGILLELVDSCYLAFDEVEKNDKN